MNPICIIREQPGRRASRAGETGTEAHPTAGLRTAPGGRMGLRARRALMNIAGPIRLAIGLFATSILSSSTAMAQLPADVRPGHWAAGAVKRTLKAGMLRVQSDGRF